MEITKEARTTIWSDIRADEENESYICLNIVVDHLDDGDNVFEMNFEENFNQNWISLEELKRLKKLVDKAIYIQKRGFK